MVIFLFFIIKTDIFMILCLDSLESCISSFYFLFFRFCFLIMFYVSSSVSGTDRFDSVVHIS